MNLQNLPTDNLYKFLALFGLIILLIINIFFINLQEKLLIEVREIESEVEELKFKIQLVEQKTFKYLEDYKDLEFELSRYQFDDTVFLNIDVKERIKNLQDPNFRDYLEFVFKYKNEIFPVFGIRNQLNETEQKLNILNDENRFRILQIEIKHNFLEERKNTIRELRWIRIFITGISAAIMALGFQLWYIKLQKPLDKKIRSDIKKEN